ncbi:hypothetical protein BU26DRAFT_440941 [Trematosphaeria pertusa]|uniref:NB-ARC domain-containing protein n=1 Tax=Trematosphaeria pertusa TaxID=390896 RepID=A0A6A6HV18_9PLEO|nr:uncharacterized protein BU26DRAFT_440941 [Trematosphaeria pertusa]KAF2241403.1 hypothetical protein BU26DRAFT_440941 [Trematosphaeria pertusa]
MQQRRRYIHPSSYPSHATPSAGRHSTRSTKNALAGLGGVGKSQLAIEHAYRTRERSPETWVFRVHASNAARFEQSYRDIADCVSISGRLNPRANIFKLVHDWLHGSKEQWLLMLDNVDDARFFDSQAHGQGQPADDSRTASRPLRTCLPRCERGSILIILLYVNEPIVINEEHKWPITTFPSGFSALWGLRCSDCWGMVQTP